MKSILEALYRGQLHPEEIIVPIHPEYRLLSRQLGAMTEKWRKELSAEMFRELEKYSDLCVSVNSLHVEAAFVHGFRLGANMIIEVMSKHEELVPNEAAGVSL
ncbi:hypothetical protein M6D81_31205 [Paenibacillus sp. J5C_2022]|uniref:DUF6809 family protein n=1 Tax=Paenibacillus sp. J5C2022 TaxID=2977129 RepID=UPI0021D130D5|nr:DUF6809 family protein [Paenibacillus sp. J5C2022]MCU6713175.1 hypothetical protein [Paenibacillus sp. J5C2022]